jgi:hypothetical protein
LRGEDQLAYIDEPAHRGHNAERDLKDVAHPCRSLA